MVHVSCFTVHILFSGRQISMPMVKVFLCFPSARDWCGPWTHWFVSLLVYFIFVAHTVWVQKFWICHWTVSTLKSCVDFFRIFPGFLRIDLTHLRLGTKVHPLTPPFGSSGPPIGFKSANVGIPPSSIVCFLATCHLVTSPQKKRKRQAGCSRLSLSHDRERIHTVRKAHQTGVSHTITNHYCMFLRNHIEILLMFWAVLSVHQRKIGRIDFASGAGCRGQTRNP